MLRIIGGPSSPIELPAPRSFFRCVLAERKSEAINM